MEEILRAITATLEDTPPELAGDIARDGILLAGGGTLLRGLPQLVTQRTGMAVLLAEPPLTCVATGSGLALNHFDQLGVRGTTRHAGRCPTGGPPETSQQAPRADHLIQALDRSAPILPLLRTSFDEFERSAMQHRDELGALALGEVADRLAGRDAAVRERSPSTVA
jgi:hypothetical protein